MWAAQDVIKGATSVPGFSAAAYASGLRKNGQDDLALIFAPQGANIAAVFTQSQVVAAPVIVSRVHAADGFAHALIVNSGNANACTGQQGIDDAQASLKALAKALSIKPTDALVASTGVIGVPLPVDRIVNNVGSLVDLLGTESNTFAQVARAIMTTDTQVKIVHTTVELDNQTYTVLGIAKGSGMIKPNMATMIGCVLTDAPLSKEACVTLLKSVTNDTFNCVTVDGDTSTNDTLVLMASGAYLDNGEVIDPPHADEILLDSLTDYEAVHDAVRDVCEELAKAIARDGEGATKLVTITVKNAGTDDDAKKVAMTIAESPLVKTALFGNDANWGRVAGAAGRAGVTFDQNKLCVTFAGIEVCHNGGALPFDEDEAFAALDKPEVGVVVDLGNGDTGHATVWTCDLSYDYVRINGEYRS